LLAGKIDAFAGTALGNRSVADAISALEAARRKLPSAVPLCPRGQRLVMAVPHGHWKTTTFVAALRHDRIDAPCVIDAPMTGELLCRAVPRSHALARRYRRHG